ncbi:MAG: RNA-binding transcriptional accessory protein [Bacteroidia bacterium]|nr:RNA-binding transcriptional accessory protein [Bacteroidia bacterium]
MKDDHIALIARELNLNINQVTAVLTLLKQGGTVPFISRYRKEATGSLDEVAIAAIRDREKQLGELDARREVILGSIRDQEKLTPDLERKIMQAATLSQLEDLYLPYRPKRRTRATVAKEKGLEPLAEFIFNNQNQDAEREARKFIDPKKDVHNVEEALAGARDILAEKISENVTARDRMRGLFEKKAFIRTKLTKGKEEEGAKFRDYFAWEESLSRAPSHRVLAMRRGEKEGILTLKIAPETEDAVQQLERQFVKGRGPAANEVALAAEDAYKRLLSSSMENEFRALSKKKADEEAIKVFADNLRQLLMAAPMGSKRVLALDPGFRTGCKVVCLDAQGKLLHHDVIYPHPPQNQAAAAEARLMNLIQKYEIEAISVGNGTAGRETLDFVKEMRLPSAITLVMVNESGASIYSASEVAREEFPDLDLTVRGAVSIGRRLMDPLAELVKIDPKSIGVGQYQHDVDQNLLKESLDDLVMSCVNGVGVEVNTASKELLTYVSGLGPALAENIVRFRNENGPFKSRAQLKKVPRLGDKAFEQAAGFLRIRDAKHPLDRSAVHPERYPIVDKMAKDLGCKVEDLMSREDLRRQIKLQNYVDAKEGVGLPTLKDILDELARPGRDPREKFEVFNFAEGINKLEDLQEGMVLPGIVTNVTKFGAFVDVGVHQDGLVHISEIADRFVKDPADVVKVQQRVKVKVKEVDLVRKRVSFSMRGLN